MPQQVRVVLPDPALAVVQVGVADPAGLDLDHSLARPWVGNDDGDQLNRSPLASGDDSPDLLRHARPPLTDDGEVAPLPIYAAYDLSDYAGGDALCAPLEADPVRGRNTWSTLTVPGIGAGRLMITTGTPRSAAASSLALVRSPPESLVISTSTAWSIISRRSSSYEYGPRDMITIQRGRQGEVGRIDDPDDRPAIGPRQERLQRLASGGQERTAARFGGNAGRGGVGDPRPGTGLRMVAPARTFEAEQRHAGDAPWPPRRWPRSVRRTDGWHPPPR